MGANMEIMVNAKGKQQLLFIDKGGKKQDVGNSLEDFEIIRKLGEGHFGSVCLVKSKKTDKLYAMKEIKGKESENDKNLREIKLMENLHHPHVITYFNSFKENGNLYIITEYINGGSLEKLMEGYKKNDEYIEEKRVWDFLVQCLSGLLYLHDTKKILHRDIKPDNLLIDADDNLKISDFGISASKTEDAPDLIKYHGTVIGPVDFMAPEMEKREDYDFKSDIYMLGLTFLCALSHEFPATFLDLGFFKIKVPNKDLKIPDQYSDEIKQFVKKLYDPDPSKRPTTSDAYIEATTIYSQKYLKTRGMGAVLHCFNSIKKINDYFTGEVVEKIMKDSSGEKKYLITSCFRDVLTSLNKDKLNIEKLNLELLKFRVILFIGKERFKSSSEVNILSFVKFLLANLHNELNKKELIRSMIGIPNDLEENFEIDKSKQTDENYVIGTVIKQFTQKCHSKISDYFCYISKGVDHCVKCNSIIKYFADLNMICTLYPDRCVKYVKKKQIKIEDLMNHYEKERTFSNEEMCPNCKKNMNFKRKKKLFTSPLSLILSLEYENSDDFELTIDEKINLANWVEKQSVCKIHYNLCGVIFEEIIEGEDKKFRTYSSISKKADGTWVLYEGNSAKNCNFSDIKNKKSPLILFYHYYE